MQHLTAYVHVAAQPTDHAASPWPGGQDHLRRREPVAPGRGDGCRIGPIRLVARNSGVEQQFGPKPLREPELGRDAVFRPHEAAARLEIADFPAGQPELRIACADFGGIQHLMRDGELLRCGNGTA